ncbi:MAG: hypothetical protein ABFS19_07170 [Thermodesulfobacteriota bacterium]
MRCPKCGYISFDHIDSCLKCGKNVANATEVKGTTFHAAAPSFLKLSSAEKEAPSDEIEFELEDDEEFEESADEILEAADSDLAMLSGEDDDELSFDEEEDDEISFDAAMGDDIEADDDEGEILEVDLGEFEETLDDDSGVSAESETLDIDMPDELSDMSDLAPPGNEPAPALSDTPPAAAKPASLNDDFDLGDDLSLDDIALDLGSDSPAGGGGDLADISLDDIDLTGGVDVSPTKDDLSLDGDLNFDLSLDGLGDVEAEKPAPPPKPTPKKTAPADLDLDDLDLSL